MNKKNGMQLFYKLKEEYYKCYRKENLGLNEMGLE